MKKFRSIMLALMLITAVTSLLADINSAAAYTRLGVDARSVGMGGTGAAFLDNVSAVFVNPASLADVQRIEFSTSTRQNMEWDRTQLFSAIGFELPLGYVALAWQNASTKDFRGYNADGSPTGNFDNNEHNFGISYAMKMGNFNFGATPKIYMSDIDGESKTGYGIDLGMIYHVNRYFNVGFVTKDLVSDFDGEGEEVPRLFIPSIAAFPIPGLVVAADLHGEKDFKEAKLKIGAEYWIGVNRDDNMGSSISGIRVEESTTWSDIFSQTEAGMRVGINDGAFAGGFGVRFKMIELNYAYQVAKEDFDNDHHLYSLSLRF
ncbi:MAG: hypothetical protein PHE08_08280 [Bacteroidales bacterium]|nr:hypothetical protein [Candidatus Cloacimonadota bacterium]MDD2199706.1 hypothetical protein [Bacteroidales bacterium]